MNLVNKQETKYEDNYYTKELWLSHIGCHG